MSLLELEHVTLKFGGVVAVDDVSFSVEPGEVFSLIGPNGAGKSTIFNLISRFYEPFAGDIRFEGKSLLDTESYDVSKLARSLSSLPKRAFHDGPRAGKKIFLRSSPA